MVSPELTASDDVVSVLPEGILMSQSGFLLCRQYGEKCEGGF
jgi:hypothetical protein